MGSNLGLKNSLTSPEPEVFIGAFMAMLGAWAVCVTVACTLCLVKMGVVWMVRSAHSSVIAYLESCWLVGCHQVALPVFSPTCSTPPS